MAYFVSSRTLNFDLVNQLLVPTCHILGLLSTTLE